MTYLHMHHKADRAPHEPENHTREQCWARGEGRGAAPDSPDLVDGDEDRRSRQLVGRVERDADGSIACAHALGRGASSSAAWGQLRTELATPPAAGPLVAVASVLVEAVLLGKGRRKVCPLARRVLVV